MTDMKMTDQIAGHEKQDMKKQDVKLQDMTHISILLFLPIQVILAVLWKI